MSRTVVTMGAHSYQVHKAKADENECKKCAFFNFCLDANWQQPCLEFGNNVYFTKIIP